MEELFHRAAAGLVERTALGLNRSGLGGTFERTIHLFDQFYSRNRKSRSGSWIWA